LEKKPNASEWVRGAIDKAMREEMGETVTVEFDEGEVCRVIDFGKSKKNQMVVMTFGRDIWWEIANHAVVGRNQVAYFGPEGSGLAALKRGEAALEALRVS